MSTLTFKQNGVNSLGCLCLLDGEEFIARKIEITLEVGKKPEIRITRKVKDVDLIFEDVKVILTTPEGRVIDNNGMKSDQDGAEQIQLY